MLALVYKYIIHSALLFKRKAQMGNIVYMFPCIVDDLRNKWRSDSYNTGNLTILENGEERIEKYRKHIGKEVDVKEFIKMYDNAIHWIWDLSRAEQRIMKMLTSQMIRWRKGDDSIYLTYKVAQKDHHYDRQRSEFYTAIRNLEKRHVLRRDPTEIGRIYLDPKSFFKGCRNQAIKNSEEK